MSLSSAFSISVLSPVGFTFQLFENRSTCRPFSFTWLPLTIKLEEHSVSEITDLLSNTVEINCLQKHLRMTDITHADRNFINAVLV